MTPARRDCLNMFANMCVNMFANMSVNMFSDEHDLKHICQHMLGIKDTKLVRLCGPQQYTKYTKYTETKCIYIKSKLFLSYPKMKHSKYQDFEIMFVVMFSAS